MARIVYVNAEVPVLLKVVEVPTLPQLYVGVLPSYQYRRVDPPVLLHDTYSEVARSDWVPPLGENVGVDSRDFMVKYLQRCQRLITVG